MKTQPSIKTKKNKLLIWANLVIVLPTLAIWAVTGLLLGDAGIYIAIIFIPLIIAMYVLLAIDIVVGIRILYKKLIG